MSTDTSAGRPSAAEIAAESDTGGRALTGTLGGFVALVAFVWSLFQLYIAPACPSWVTETLGINLVFNNHPARSAPGLRHRAGHVAYPLFKRSSRTSVPAYDWVLAIIGAASCLYLLVLQERYCRSSRPADHGGHRVLDPRYAQLGIAVFRSLGLPLVIVASVFVLYVFSAISP
jgi:TRAP-type uncharacterized transport system fused permease subunit